MATSSSKRGRPAIGAGTPVQVRLQPDHLRKLDEWIASTDPDLGRAEAIRKLISDHAGEEANRRDQLLDRGLRLAGRVDALNDVAEIIERGGDLPTILQQLARLGEAARDEHEQLGAAVAPGQSFKRH